MKMKFKLSLYIVVVDLLLYLFLFHSGIVLPVINPSVQEYNQQFTSFPRDAIQKIIWIGVHIPTSFAISSFLGDKNIFLSIVQSWIIFFSIGSLIDFRRKKKEFTTREQNWP